MKTLAVLATGIISLSYSSGAFAQEGSGTSITADSYDSSSGVLLLHGSDTLAHYQQVLRTVKYENDAAPPNPTDRTINVVANDGALEDAQHNDGGPAWQAICLQNESFEGMPAFNSGVPDMFDALPWTSCVDPSMSMANTPDIGNDTIQQIFATVPKATDDGHGHAH